MQKLRALRQRVVGGLMLALAVGFIPATYAQSEELQALTGDVVQLASALEDLHDEFDAKNNFSPEKGTIAAQLTSLEALVQSLDLRLDRALESDRAQNAKLTQLEQKIARLEQTLALSEAPVADPLNSAEPATNATADDVAAPRSAVEAVEANATAGPDVSPTFIETPVVGSRRPDEEVTSAPARPVFSVPPRLYPGTVVPIETRDEQGEIERPIPQRRPSKDVDPQPMSEADFLALFGSDASVEASLSAPSDPEQVREMAAQAYNAAYAYIQVNDLAAAEVAFQDFLDEFPDHPLASNAGYWLGESFYARDMYGAAVRAFAGSVRDYRDGRKAPDALLKLSMTLAVLGQTSEACRLLEFLPQEYPNAEAEILSRTDAERRKLVCASAE